MRDWLSHRVAATPDAEAFVLATSGETLTYAELDARTEALASRLAGLGIVPGDHLAVVLDNRVDYVTLVHAAMRLGVRLVLCSDRLTADELAPQLAAADATALVCGATTEAVAAEAALGEATEGTGGAEVEFGWRTVDGFEPARPTDRGGDGDSDGDRADNSARDSDGDRARDGDGDSPTATGDEPGDSSVPVVSLDEATDERVVCIGDAPDAEVPSVRWRRTDALLVLFTSGSTGDPKPVALTMGNVLASATASAFRLGVLPDDRYLATLSLHHTGGVMPLYRAVLYGTSIVLRREFDAGGAVDDIRRYDVTGVSLVPTMLTRMLDARGTLPSSLRTVLLGGAPAPEALIERCRNYSVPVHPTWGMTEAASQLTTARPEEAFDRVDTAGRPLLWTEVTVRDENGTELPAGETGELVVSGPSVTSGYYGDPEATDAAFTDDGALRTGDVGRRDEDGYVYVLNRLDDRIITGGENVDPGEVTETLRDHPGVDDAAVVGIPDEEWGERVAALVVRSDPDLGADEVESFCREHLAGFKLPRTIAFAEELPRTVSGTVHRPAVRESLETERATDADAGAAAGASHARDAGDAAERGGSGGGDAAGGSHGAGDDDGAVDRDVVADDDGADDGDVVADDDGADDGDVVADDDGADDGDTREDGNASSGGDGVEGGSASSDGDVPEGSTTTDDGGATGEADATDNADGPVE